MPAYTVCILTLGCRVNQYESDAIGERLIQLGMTLVSAGEKAHVTIVNTCTVTGESDRKSRQMIRRAAADGSAVIVTGCYAQIAPADVLAIPGVRYVCGNGEKSTLPDIALALAKGNLPAEKNGVTDIYTAPYDLLSRHVPRRYRSFIKIEDGCDNRCAYCIIPRARGKVRSRPKSDILKEAAALAAAGSPEVILTGIETASYGMDQHGDTRLPYGMALTNLLAEVDILPHIQRISLGSLEPTVMSPAFVQKLGTLSHLLPHFHLSIQSGCTTVLHRMRRRYTAQKALESIRLLRAAIPDVTFSADIIVGFPGETEEEAAQTLAFIEEARFLHLHLFPYSIRKGTEAAVMENQIPEPLKKARLRKLEEVQNHIRLTMLREYVCAHRTDPVYVLVEQWKDGIANGHTEHYVEVNISTEQNTAGQILPITLTKTDGLICWGEVAASAALCN